MVDFKNLRFTVPQVVSICNNLSGIVYIGATITIKLDTLIAAQNGKEMKDEQLHKEQAAETRSIMMEQVSQGTRLTLAEQKISNLELFKK